MNPSFSCSKKFCGILVGIDKNVTEQDVELAMKGDIKIFGNDQS